eukprot:scaffold4734_cov261-Chaetoceros_neogracile.AAC.4
MGAGLILFPLMEVFALVFDDSRVPLPLVQSVAKFSHAMGAASQCICMTILFPWVAGGLTCIPSLSFPHHSIEMHV